MHLLGEVGPCRHGNQELGSDWVNGWMLVENLVALTSKKGHYVKVKGDLQRSAAVYLWLYGWNLP